MPSKGSWERFDLAREIAELLSNIDRAYVPMNKKYAIVIFKTYTGESQISSELFRPANGGNAFVIWMFQTKIRIEIRKYITNKVSIKSLGHLARIKSGINSKSL